MQRVDMQKVIDLAGVIPISNIDLEYEMIMSGAKILPAAINCPVSKAKKAIKISTAESAPFFLSNFTSK